MLIQKYNYTPINRDTVEGKRLYTLPDGSRVPSVTTILDKTKPKEKQEALANWKNVWVNKPHSKLPQKLLVAEHVCTNG